MDIYTIHGQVGYIDGTTIYGMLRRVGHVTGADIYNMHHQVGYVIGASGSDTALGGAALLVAI